MSPVWVSAVLSEGIVDAGAVALGGAIGALARWRVAEVVQGNRFFPYGTLFVNMLGCIILGLVMGAASLYGAFSKWQRLLLATGFAGAFTTFSTFIYESFILALDYSLLYASAYIVMSLALGTLSVYLGRIMAGMVYGRWANTLGSGYT